MTQRIIYNGHESFVETKNLIKVNNQFRTVYSRRMRAEHQEFIVFYLFGELKNNAGRYMIVNEDQFVKKGKK